MPPRPKYTQEHWNAFLGHLAELGTPSRVLKQLPGMPTYTLFLRRMASDADFAAKVGAIWTPSPKMKPVAPATWYAFIDRLAELGTIEAVCAQRGMPSFQAVRRKIENDSLFAARVEKLRRRREYTPATWAALLDHCKSHRIADACELPGMPSYAAFRGKRARDPEFAARVRKVIEQPEARHLNQPRYSPQTWGTILVHLETMSIADVCRLPGMPTRKCIYDRMRREPHFAKSIEEARGRQIRRFHPYDSGLGADEIEKLWEVFLDRLESTRLTDLCSEPGMPSVSSFEAKRHGDPAFHLRASQIFQESGRRRDRVSPARWEAFLAALTGPRTLVDICSDPDMPHTATVSARNRTDPLFAARFADISRKRKKRRIAEALAAKRGRTLRTKSTGKATTPVLSFDKHLSHDAIYRAAAAVVPTSLPPITRDDIICDMVLAVLEGHLDQSQLKTRSKEFIKEHWRMFGTLRDVSLDAQMFDDGGTTRKDRLGGHGADYW